MEMYNGMMDPELTKLAQEQMSRIPPEEFARIQQQMMANPELLRLETESMKNMRPEDMKRAAEQLKHVRTEDMVEASEKMAKASPEEIASLKARADAQISYEISATEMLKQKGNELHSCGKYHEAAKKYLLGKNNMKAIPAPKAKTLQTQCSLNLMSCYLKMKQFEDCIREGTEVVEYDSNNVKAFYCRGQAYKELGNLHAAVSDFNKAHEISPDDETIADAIRDTNNKLISEGGSRNVRQGLVIEEILEDEMENIISENDRSSAAEYHSNKPVEASLLPQNIHQPSSSTAIDKDSPENFRENSKNIRLFQNCVANADPRTLEDFGMQGLSPQMAKTATDMISKMSPEELQKMFQVALSLNGKGPDASPLGSKLPEMTPEIIKMTSDTISKMPPEELQKMFKVASSLNANGAPSTSTVAPRSENGSVPSVAARSLLEENNSGAPFVESRMGQSSSSIPTSSAAFQESMKNSMKDPAMRQMDVDSCYLDGNADVVEFCPHSSSHHILAVGTYTLQEGPQPQRTGSISLFSTDPIVGLELLCRVPTVGVFDMKWSSIGETMDPVLAQAGADGGVILYKLELKTETSKGNVLREFCSRKISSSMCLCLDWDPMSCSISLGHSDGSISLVTMGDDQLQLSQSWVGHDHEVWATSFDVDRRNLLYTGSDDCNFSCWDLRTHPSDVVFRNSKSHKMGVCCIAQNPINTNILLTGSYDESIRVWDLRLLSRPVCERSLCLGGGVWRIKYHPYIPNLILAACMHNGFAIVKTDDEDIQLVETYSKHESLAYGADWQRGPRDLQRKGLLVATCSFYDSHLRVWQPNILM